MDIYVIVAEIELPSGGLAAWLETAPPPVRGRVWPAPSALIDGAEGDVVAEVRGDRLSLRMSLVDAAYFAVSEGLRGAFVRAAALGGRGTWYSGDHISGQVGVLGQAETPTRLVAAPIDVREWVAEAVDLAARALAGEAAPRTFLTAPTPTTKAPATQRSKKAAAPAKKSSKKSSKK